MGGEGGSWLSAEHRKVPRSLWHCGEGALLTTAPSKLSNTGKTASDFFLKVQDFLVHVKYRAFVSLLDKGWADLYGGSVGLGMHTVCVCVCVCVCTRVCGYVTCFIFFTCFLCGNQLSMCVMRLSAQQCVCMCVCILKCVYTHTIVCIHCCVNHV